MDLISRRECHLIESKDEDLNRFVEEIKSFLVEQAKRIPDDYAVNVYKNAVACCGYFPIGITVEIKGPKNEPIKELDLMIYSKIIEICEREGVEHHECGPLEII